MPLSTRPPRAVHAEGGMTLIEVMVAILVLGVALQLVLPDVSRRIEDLRSATAMRHLSSLLAYARHEALLRGLPVTVCALDAAGACQRSWTDRHEVTAFIDRDANQRRDGDDAALRAVRWPLARGELSWRASLGRSYLRFEAAGNTWQNGTLYYCPASRDARFARALVVSQSGRNYLTGDGDGDGVREDRHGRNLVC